MSNGTDFDLVAAPADGEVCQPVVFGLATARADAWQEQPFSLEYHLDGTKHRYTPDVLVGWGTHQEDVEIKEDSEADSPENRTRFGLIWELLAEQGLYFRVWRKSEISA